MSGFQYLRARYYDPETGRFLSRDSCLGEIQDPLTLKRYIYVLNNPLIYNDKSGNIAFLAITGLIGAAIGAGVGAYTSYKKTGKVSVKSVVTGAVIGGAAGLGIGSVTAAYFTGSMVASAPAVISGIIGALFSKGPQLYNVVDKHFDDVLDTIEDFRAKKSGKEIGTNILIRVAVGGVTSLAEKTMLKSKPPACSSDTIESQQNNYNSKVIDVPSNSGSTDVEDSFTALKNSGSSQKGTVEGAGKAELGSKTGYEFKEGVDIDLRGSGKTYNDALEEAFDKTGTPRSDFEVTKWAKDANGKSFPVEWRAKNGAEVNIDIGHTTNGPDVPHVGYQTGGKRGS